jgi:hypothetical protein
MFEVAGVDVDGGFLQCRTSAVYMLLMSQAATS